jgi:hypothetical protein
VYQPGGRSDVELGEAGEGKGDRRGKVTAAKSEAENVALVVAFTAVYQNIPALSISWLSRMALGYPLSRLH